MINEIMNNGIFPKIKESSYHALPRLSSSGMKMIIEDCPAAFRYAADHPERDDPSRDTEIGTAAHLLLLEPQSPRLVLIDAEDYRTKVAKELRSDAYADGRSPILAPDMEKAKEMVTAFYRQAAPLPSDIAAEVSYLWTDPETGTALKARPDGATGGMLIDYKTTANAHPEAFARRVVDNGHHIQAAHYLAGHRVLTGRDADWLWIVQSTKPPFLVSVHRPTQGTLQAGYEKVRAAIAIYNACRDSGKWPGYEAPTPDGVWSLDLPVWAKFQHEERRERGDFLPPKKPSAADLERAVRAQAP